MGLVMLFYYLINFVLLSISILILVLNYKKNLISGFTPLVAVILCAIIYYFLYNFFTTNKTTYVFEPWFKFPTYLILYPALLGILLNFFKKFTYINFCSSVLLFTAIIGTLLIILFYKYTLNILETLKLPKHY